MGSNSKILFYFMMISIIIIIADILALSICNFLDLQKSYLNGVLKDIKIHMILSY